VALESTNGVTNSVRNPLAELLPAEYLQSRTAYGSLKLQNVASVSASPSANEIADVLGGFPVGKKVTVWAVPDCSHELLTVARETVVYRYWCLAAACAGSPDPAGLPSAVKSRLG